MIGVIGQQLQGQSHRFGVLLSIERAGVFLIIHFNHVRYWLGIGRTPKYIKGKKYI